MRRDAALAALVKEADRHDWASDIESISRYSLSVHQATLRHIRVIRICGDRESLDELKKTIQALLERHEEREARCRHSPECGSYGTEPCASAVQYSALSRLSSSTL